MFQWTKRLSGAAIAGVCLLAYVTSPARASDDASAFADRRTQCTQWMVGGYPSGLEEKACTWTFGLPSPFLFKCARAQKWGYENETQKQACISFFAKASEAAGDGYVRR